LSLQPPQVRSRTCVVCARRRSASRPTSSPTAVVTRRTGRSAVRCADTRSSDAATYNCTLNEQDHARTCRPRDLRLTTTAAMCADHPPRPLLPLYLPPPTHALGLSQPALNTEHFPSVLFSGGLNDISVCTSLPVHGRPRSPLMPHRFLEGLRVNDISFRY